MKKRILSILLSCALFVGCVPESILGFTMTVQAEEQETEEVETKDPEQEESEEQEMEEAEIKDPEQDESEEVAAELELVEEKDEPVAQADVVNPRPIEEETKGTANPVNVEYFEANIHKYGYDKSKGHSNYFNGTSVRLDSNSPYYYGGLWINQVAQTQMAELLMNNESVVNEVNGKLSGFNFASDEAKNEALQTVINAYAQIYSLSFMSKTLGSKINGVMSLTLADTATMQSGKSYTTYWNYYKQNNTHWGSGTSYESGDQGSSMHGIFNSQGEPPKSHDVYNQALKYTAETGSGGKASNITLNLIVSGSTTRPYELTPLSNIAVHVPELWNDNWVRNQNSASDSEYAKATWETKFPFVVEEETNEGVQNGVKHYSYDSSSATGYTFQASYNDNEKTARSQLTNVSKTVNIPWGTPKYGFFPFNYQLDQGNAGLKTIEEAIYHFGMDMDFQFMIPQGGKYKNSNEDIKFQFSGDDDVLVYVDGKLVLENGGLHGVRQSNINFTEKAITYQFVSNIEDQRVINGANGQTRHLTYYWDKDSGKVKVAQSDADGKNRTELPNETVDNEIEQAVTLLHKIQGDGSIHKFDFYYLERGSSESNMKLEFNIQKMDTIQIEKHVDGISHENDEFNFVAYGLNDEAITEESQLSGIKPEKWIPISGRNYTIHDEKHQPLRHGVLKEDGKFMLHDGEHAVFEVPSSEEKITVAIVEQPVGLFMATKLDYSVTGETETEGGGRDEELSGQTLIAKQLINQINSSFNGIGAVFFNVQGGLNRTYRLGFTNKMIVPEVLSEANVVVDYGLPISQNLDEGHDAGEHTHLGILLEDESGTIIDRVGVSTAEKEELLQGKYGKFSINEDGVITYYPTTMRFAGIDKVKALVKNDTDGTYGTRDFKVMPATSVYYEDDESFIQYTDQRGSGIETKDASEKSSVQTSKWTVLDSHDGNDTEQDNGIVGDRSFSAYGYDSHYDDDTRFSNGKAHYLNVPSEDYTTGTGGDGHTYYDFSFTGTGFDLISNTGQKQGAINVKVYSGAEISGTPVKNYFVQNTGASELYQIPVMSVEDLSYGTYCVRVTCHAAYDNTMIPALSRGPEHTIDGIRIYNPMNLDKEEIVEEGDVKTVQANYKVQMEAFPRRMEVRDVILKADSFNGLGGNTADGVVWMEGLFNKPTTGGGNGDNGTGEDKITLTVEDYKLVGPNNEVYLPASSTQSSGETFERAIGFDLVTSEIPQTLQIGAKSVAGTDVKLNVALVNPDDPTISVTLSKDLHQTSAQNYSLNSGSVDGFENVFAASDGGYHTYVYISNAGTVDNQILSLTDIKTTFTSPNATKRLVSNEPVVNTYRAFRMLMLDDSEPDDDIESGGDSKPGDDDMEQEPEVVLPTEMKAKDFKASTAGYVTNSILKWLSGGKINRTNSATIQVALDQPLPEGYTFAVAQGSKWMEKGFKYECKNPEATEGNKEYELTFDITYAQYGTKNYTIYVVKEDDADITDSNILQAICKGKVSLSGL